MSISRRKISNDSSIESELKRQKFDRNTKDAKVAKVAKVIISPFKTKVFNVKINTSKKNSPRKYLVMIKQPNLNLHLINSSLIINIAAVKLFQKVKVFSTRFFF